MSPRRNYFLEAYPSFLNNFCTGLPNGWRYPLVGGTRQRHFAGTSFKPRKVLENAQTPTSRVHAVLGGDFCSTFNFECSIGFLCNLLKH
jgi:hypothetical protein